jgi:hypothetical protein
MLEEQEAKPSVSPALPSGALCLPTARWPEQGCGQHQHHGAHLVGSTAEPMTEAMDYRQG